MDKTKQDKITRFLSDRIMSEAVREVLVSSFLRKRGISVETDVHVLAAARLAIDFLEDGWRELEKHRISDGADASPTSNIGL